MPNLVDNTPPPVVVDNIPKTPAERIADALERIAAQLEAQGATAKKMADLMAAKREG